MRTQGGERERMGHRIYSVLTRTGFKEEMLVGELVFVLITLLLALPEKSHLKKEGLVQCQFDSTINTGGRTP